MSRYQVILLLDVCTTSPAFADGDPAKGKALIKSWGCIECHGLTGNERSTPDRFVPMLAGQPAVFIAKRLKDYKQGKFADLDDWARMNTLVQGLGDEDMADIGAYFEAQKRY